MSDRTKGDIVYDQLIKTLIAIFLLIMLSVTGGYLAAIEDAVRDSLKNVRDGMHYQSDINSERQRVHELKERNSSLERSNEYAARVLRVIEERFPEAKAVQADLRRFEMESRSK